LTGLEGRLAEIPALRGIPTAENGWILASSETGTKRMARDAARLALVIASPQRCGLIADFSPYQRGAMEQIIDRFLAEFEGLGVRACWLHAPTDMVVELVALAVVICAWRVIPKIRRLSRDGGELAIVEMATSLDGISGLPGSASLEE
jgi:hypothetical protein